MHVSIQNLSNMASKSMSKHGQKNDRKSGLLGAARRRDKSGCWPLITYSIHGPGNLQGLRDTPLRARGTVAESNRATNQPSNATTVQQANQPANQQTNKPEMDRKMITKLLKNRSPILENWSKIDLKSVQKRSKIDPERLLGCPGAILAPRWPQLGSKMAPKANISQHNKHFSPQVGVQFGAKIDQKSTKNRYKMASVFWWILEPIFLSIWSQLGPKMGAKTVPKWSQVGCKMDATKGIDLRPVF